MSANVLWFRRDLRLRDNPALLAAAGQAGFGDRPSAVVPLFVVDPALWQPSGAVRRAYLVASLGALGDRIGGDGLLIRRGDPVAEVVSVARAADAPVVYAAADFGPYGRARDSRVAAALEAHGIRLEFVGSPYAVAPGRVTKDSGEPYQVFSPFFRAWCAHGWREPAGSPRSVRWEYPLVSSELPAAPVPEGLRLPTAGEDAALRRWRAFRDRSLPDYADARNRPDLDGTSQLSHALKWGEIHPRTLLADLDPEGDETYLKELAWREFYADVLFHRPESAREYLRAEYARMRYAEPDEAFEAWCSGRTGFPFVDAGMRQLRAEGWVHNRVRMVVASFLVKDLHVEWQHGARHFLRWLRDGDLASNQHGWQWVAGCGTDAAPYFRVFNPVTQGLKFDPTGDYVRRYVPELAHLDGKAAHTPWEVLDGYAHGYPERIVDHAAERAEALARLAEISPPRPR
ncbi:cryptochrome/photolyase family protein [Sporichthya polymorpha]|uniref:cryptochrome/photolyase family protein n=1 Tax=Sporichthya polymorpha TaxID=35751 RepID=UPI00037B77EF|nr:deoxyribodipyrimidine photo-lyase [Sporichthya polymorpha]